MKNNIGVIILFALLFIASLSYGIYTGIKCEALDRSYKGMSLKYENASLNKKNYITISDIDNKTSSYIYNLYAYKYPSMVIGFEGELYQIEAVGESLRGCLGDLTGTDRVKFTDDVYKCEALQRGYVKENPFIKKLNIKEENIEKVIISRNPSSISSSSYITFFVYKTGDVKFSVNSGELKIFKGLKNYKVKSVEHFYCSFGSYDTCSGGYKLEVITKNSKFKTINIKESELQIDL